MDSYRFFRQIWLKGPIVIGGSSDILALTRISFPATSRSENYVTTNILPLTDILMRRNMRGLVKSLPGAAHFLVDKNNHFLNFIDMTEPHTPAG